MKLHLPKLLLTAVMAACVAPAFADVNVPAGETVIATGSDNYTVGEGGTLDINGTKLIGKTVTLAENATLANSGGATGENQQQIAKLILTGSAFVSAENGAYGLIASGWERSDLVLDGNTLTKTGDGTFYLVTTTVSGGGTISVNEGTLQIGCSDSGNRNTNAENVVFETTDGAKVTLVNGGDLIAAGFSGDGGSIEATNESNAVVLNSNNNYTYGGDINGGFNLVKKGSGIQTFAGNVDLGAVTFTQGGAGIVFGGDSTSTISVSSVNVDASHNLVAVEGNAYTIDGQTASDNGFRTAGTKYLLFTGYEWNPDSAEIEGYTLSYENGNTYITSNSATAKLFYVNKGTVTYDANFMKGASFFMRTGTSYVMDLGAADVTIEEITSDGAVNVTAKTTGAVTMGDNFSIAEGSTLTIDGAKSFTNSSKSLSCTIELKNVTEANFVADGEDKKYIGANVILSGTTTLNVTGNTDIVNYNAQNLTWTVGSEATLNFGNHRQTFANGFTLIVDGGKVIGAGDSTHGAIDIATNGTIRATKNSTVNAYVRVRNGQLTLDAGKDITLTMAGNIINSDNSQSGGVKKTGSGTVVLSGSNTYKNGTTISEGTVKTNNAKALGTGAVSVAAGANLELGSSLTVSSNLTIDEGGSLIFGNGTKLTVSGTLTLANANDIKLAEGITFDSADDVTLATTGTLALGEGFDATTWAGAGTYTIEGVKYTSSLKAEGDKISVTFKQMVEAPGEPISVMGWDLTGTALTLDVNAALSEGMEVSVHLLEDTMMKDILAKLGENYTDGKPMVTITLQGTSGTITADKMNEVVFVKGETGQNYWGEMVDGVGLMYNVERIPEPASATLSLAALMMLCARRRRRA